MLESYATIYPLQPSLTYIIKFSLTYARIWTIGEVTLLEPNIESARVLQVAVLPCGDHALLIYPIQVGIIILQPEKNFTLLKAINCVQFYHGLCFPLGYLDVNCQKEFLICFECIDMKFIV